MSRVLLAALLAASPLFAQRGRPAPRPAAPVRAPAVTVRPPAARPVTPVRRPGYVPRPAPVVTRPVAPVPVRPRPPVGGRPDLRPAPVVTAPRPPGTRPGPTVVRPTINRPTVVRPTINRPTTVINKTNVTNIVRGGTTINNTVINRNTAINRGVPGSVVGYRRPWGSYHGGWYHGSWGGTWSRVPSFWLGYGLGRRSGYGPYGVLPAFYNPYYFAPPVVSTTVIESPALAVAPGLNYSQPIEVPTPEEQSAADGDVPREAAALFDAARDHFRRARYAEATAAIERALRLLPGDTTMHEFRALCLFARGRYKDAAGALYAVLAAGPGMDWETMSSLYPDRKTYTDQLHILEQFVRDDPKRGEGHFLLGYHYLTIGERDAAAAEFAEASRAQPKDTLSASLYQSLTAEK